MADAGKTTPFQWIGWVLTILVTLFFLWDGGFQVLGTYLAPDALQELMGEGGFSMDQALGLGSTILVSTILYAIPRTAVLGAILITGYLGGAICTEVRLGHVGSPPQLMSIALGVMAWGGLYLRDPRVSALIPFASPAHS